MTKPPGAAESIKSDGRWSPSKPERARRSEAFTHILFVALQLLKLRTCEAAERGGKERPEGNLTLLKLKSESASDDHVHPLVADCWLVGATAARPSALSG